MLVLVSDTSVLIDLGRGDLLEACFALPWQFAVPDLLYARELAAENGPELIARGLQVVTLTSAELGVAQATMAADRRLSAPDAAAFALARTRKWPLHTGDNVLRARAKAERISFYGVLWVCDAIFAAAVVTPAHCHNGLRTIASHPRCRLPRQEIERRLAHYRGTDK